MKYILSTIIISLCVMAHTAPGDVIMLQCDPPTEPYAITGGNCGEACMWTILHRLGQKASQRDINQAGGNPGRGLYSHELIQALRKYKVEFSNRSRRTSDYNNFITSEIIPALRNGKPIILGVKVYPDTNKAWSCDHFILVVGYNLSSRELIINDIGKRDRVSIKQLTYLKTGYSIASSHRHVFAIIIN